MKVVFYSTKCQNCRMLETALKNKGIQYEEINDVSTILDKGMTSIPQLEVDGQLMLYPQAKEWVLNYKN